MLAYLERLSLPRRKRGWLVVELLTVEVVIPPPLGGHVAHAGLRPAWENWATEFVIEHEEALVCPWHYGLLVALGMGEVTPPSKIFPPGDKRFERYGRRLLLFAGRECPGICDGRAVRPRRGTCRGCVPGCGGHLTVRILSAPSDLEQRWRLWEWHRRRGLFPFLLPAV